MATKTNPKIIGGFVVGAIALTVAGLLAFGGGSYFKPTSRAVLFFEGQSLAGLDVGSPVTFRGIKVGNVTNIKLEYDVAAQHLYIPVYIQIDPDKFQLLNGERSENNIQTLVQRGLRAQLEVQSLVTGQVNVNFDFHPGTPITLTGLDRSVQELPTVPSELSALKASVAGALDRISKLPLEKIADELSNVLQSADSTLKDVDAQVKPLGESFKSTSDQAGQVLANIDAQLKPLAESLRATSEQANKLLSNADADLPQLVAAAQQVMKSANIALSQADQTLRAAQNVVSPDAPVFYEITSTLREIKSAASSLRLLAEYLERNPNALLTGKK
ncbi:MAG TPA: MlaD family protein [Stellaceae bacterium]|nr:MlaD family protein [Stellaceae bacterium]